jgi:hypothetical protein
MTDTAGIRRRPAKVSKTAANDSADAIEAVVVDHSKDQKPNAETRLEDCLEQGFSSQE